MRAHPPGVITTYEGTNDRWSASGYSCDEAPWYFPVAVRNFGDINDSEFRELKDWDFVDHATISESSVIDKGYGTDGTRFMGSQ
jgi:hypothetical protein